MDEKLELGIIKEENLHHNNLNEDGMVYTRTIIEMINKMTESGIAYNDAINLTLKFVSNRRKIELLKYKNC